jgi:hypothetical protein
MRFLIDECLSLDLIAIAGAAGYASVLFRSAAQA